MIILIVVFAGVIAFLAGYRLGVSSQQGKPIQTPSGIAVPERKKLTLREWEILELKNKKRIESVFDNDGVIDEKY